MSNKLSAPTQRVRANESKFSLGSPEQTKFMYLARRIGIIIETAKNSGNQIQVSESDFITLQRHFGTVPAFSPDPTKIAANAMLYCEGVKITCAPGIPDRIVQQP